MSHLRTTVLAVFVLAATGCGEPIMEASTQTTVPVTASPTSPSTTTSTVAEYSEPSASTSTTVVSTTSFSMGGTDTTSPGGTGGGDEAATSEENTVTTSPSSEPAVPPFGSDIDAALLAAITADAESRLGAVTVVSIESTVWSDTSLGCPETGMMYATVLTPGHIVVVSGGGSTLEYHTNTQAGTFVTC
jgi:hypothetical protein